MVSCCGNAKSRKWLLVIQHGQGKVQPCTIAKKANLRSSLQIKEEKEESKLHTKMDHCEND